MIKDQLELVLGRATTWPKAAQDELIRSVERIESTVGAYKLSAEERAAVEEGLAQADRGELLDGDEVFDEVLRELEKSGQSGAVGKLIDDLPLFSAPPSGEATPSEVERLLSAARLDELSPRQALELLYQLKALIEKG